MATIVGLLNTQPDISYAPDLDKYKARTRRRLNSETLPKSLPAGCPKKLNSKLVWEGRDLEDAFEWVLQLTSSDLEEVESALRHFKSMLPLERYNLYSLSEQL